MTEEATLEAIRKTVTVDAPIEAAFRTFTHRFADWWPVKKYSMGLDRAERAILEPREGGRVYETQAGGEEVEWGRVLVYEPPERVVLAWGLNGSEVEVRFHSEGNRTVVDLEHRGWERLEDKEQRESYDAGWDEIVAAYVSVANEVRDGKRGMGISDFAAASTTTREQTRRRTP